MFLAIVAALVIAGLTLVRFPAERRGGEEPQEDRPTSVFEGVELFDQDSDGTRWRVRGERGFATEAQVSGTLEGVRAEFEREDWRLEVTAGKADLKEGVRLHVSGGVDLSWEAYRVQVPQAVYHKGRGLITSEDDVLLAGPGIRVRGVGLEIDVRTHSARVLSRVRAELTEGLR